jgi:diguanylate cyclase (GGDEF)-like protein
VRTAITVISKIGERPSRAESCLVVIYGQEIGRRHALVVGETVIGRSHRADIQIAHDSVSRRHARIQVEEEFIRIADLGSTNGTYVNDVLVENRKLRDGDLVKIGRTILKYLSGGNVEQAYHEEIFRLTTYDGLTKCFNERYLKDQLAREISRAHRYQRPLSVMVFDVDELERLNDDYGHMAGDALLAQVADRIRDRVREEDIFARLNGGLFALVLPETVGEQAEYLEEKVQELVASRTFHFDDITFEASVTTSSISLEDLDVVRKKPASFLRRKGAAKEAVSVDETDVDPNGQRWGEETREGNDKRTPHFRGLCDTMVEGALDRLGEAKKGR